jgi:uncharacterized protein YsxB (DUF464 family)
MGDEKPRTFSVSRQLGFHQLLVAARKEWLIDGLKEGLAKVDAVAHRNEIARYTPATVLASLAQAGVREDYIFPTPSLLEAAPSLVGYYRLLLGIPQKSFYASGTGMSRYKSMETKGTITEKQKKGLDAFCSAISASLADLVQQISPMVSVRDIHELPLLTFGSQLQGANNNKIGKQATIDVFHSVAIIAQDYTEERTDKRLVLRNASGRIVKIVLGSDPDISVSEEFEGEPRNKVAIEIKGGSDKSNAHNRAGEAEKSHQKARGLDFRDFWTLIAKKGLDMERVVSESPTTTSWFDVAHVLAREGDDWELFRRELSSVLGIRLSDGGSVRGKYGSET